MATKGGEAPLSPTELQINVRLQAVRTGEVQVTKDPQGRFEITYNDTRTIHVGHGDKSKAPAIQVGKDANDTRLLVKACLEIFDVIKQKQELSGVDINEINHGVAIDQTKVGISALGRYTEGQQFIRLEEVLGRGNCAGDIVVVKDKETGTEHALKTVMISEFSTNEVRCWVDLGDSDHFPRLYLFQLNGNKVALHMEKVERGVTLTDIIDSHMANLSQNAPELKRPFSLCVFHGLLSAVRKMHDKNWAHCDLHGGNVMITKDTMMLKILDFGMARPLREGFNFNQDALKNDILNAIRLFCGVYIGQDFGGNFSLEREIKAGTLKKVLKEAAHLSKEEREELLQLIMMTYQVTQNSQQAGSVMKCIEDKLSADKLKDVMRQAAAVLFPDFYRTARDIALGERGEEEVVDETTDFDLEEAAKAIPDDLLQELSIRLRGKDA